MDKTIELKETTYNLRDKNTSRKYKTGTIWNTKTSGDIKILGQLDIRSKSSGYDVYLIEFLENGYITKSCSSNIKRGIPRSPYAKTFFNVGFIGVGDHKYSIDGKHTKEAMLWQGLLSRVFSSSFHKKRPSYVGSSVDERWHNFQNFCEDIQHLENYDKWKCNTKNRAWHLDKDIKVEGNKHYSKDTCMFVTARENSAEANTRTKSLNRIFKGERLSDGKVEIIKSIKNFKEKYNLSNIAIWGCVFGGQKTSKGWKFSLIEGGKY